MAQIEPQAPRVVAPCPWCGAGTRLMAKNDGLGATALCCTNCGGRGPSVDVTDDFAAAEVKAVALWSSRSLPPVVVSPPVAVPGLVVDRVRTSASLARAVAQRDDLDIFAEVRVADLQEMINAVTRS